MTYCVAMKLDSGLVFLADSRTNAGVDHISTFRKLTVFDHPGERMLVLMSAGNLAIAQAVRQLLCEPRGADDATLWNVSSLSEAARVVGDAIRAVHARDGASLKNFGIDFNASFILGGQIRGEAPRLFLIYAAGNFIEATPENPYFQIGEAKYGKPILDRVITPASSLDEAAKCALISMDSTLRSNISVGLPLDLLVYETDSLRVSKFVHIDQHNHYMQVIKSTWGARLRQVFQEIPDPQWSSAEAGAGAAEPMRAPRPASLRADELVPPAVQMLADSAPPTQPD